MYNLLKRKYFIFLFSFVFVALFSFPWIIKAVLSQWASIVGTVYIIRWGILIGMRNLEIFSDFIGPLALIVYWVSGQVVIVLVIIIEVPEVGSPSSSFFDDVDHLLIAPNSGIRGLTGSSNISTAPTLGTDQDLVSSPAESSNLFKSFNPLFD